jgi:hypothetical protein
MLKNIPKPGFASGPICCMNRAGPTGSLIVSYFLTAKTLKSARTGIIERRMPHFAPGSGTLSIGEGTGSTCHLLKSDAIAILESKNHRNLSNASLVPGQEEASSVP